MSLIEPTDLPDIRHFLLYELCRDVEKRAAVRLSGLLQATKDGRLIVGVPTSLVRGVFDAMDVPGISLPNAVDGGALRGAITVMTQGELKQVGGPAAVKERGKRYAYSLGRLTEAAPRGMPGISRCWSLEVSSPELGTLRRTYGLPTRLPGDRGFSILIACRKSGVLQKNDISRTAEQAAGRSLPDWAG